MATRFHTRGIIDPLKVKVRGVAHAGDMASLFSYAQFCGDYFPFSLFVCNCRWFSGQGLYEKALLSAWERTQGTFELSLHMSGYLSVADRQNLRSASSPWPEWPQQGRYLYRGIAGDDARPWGLSWTLSLEMGEFFATKHNSWLYPQRLYRRWTTEDEVFAFLNTYRKEEECLFVLPVDDPKIELVQEWRKDAL